MKEYGVIAVDSELNAKIYYTSEKYLSDSYMGELIGDDCEDICLMMGNGISELLETNMDFNDKSRQVIGVGFDHSKNSYRKGINFFGSIMSPKSDKDGENDIYYIHGTMLLVGVELQFGKSVAVGLDMVDETLRLFKAVKEKCEYFKDLIDSEEIPDDEIDGDFVIISIDENSKAGMEFMDIRTLDLNLIKEMLGGSREITISGGERLGRILNCNSNPEDTSRPIVGVITGNKKTSESINYAGSYIISDPEENDPTLISGKAVIALLDSNKDLSITRIKGFELTDETFEICKRVIGICKEVENSDDPDSWLKKKFEFEKQGGK